MEDVHPLSGPDPARITTIDDLVHELGLLRSRAARGTRSARVSLEELAARAGEPRSTIHAYLTGKRFAPAQVLDRLVIALGSTADEQREWAEAWFRVSADRERGARPAAAAATRRLLHQLPAGGSRLTGLVGELAELDELLLRPCQAPVVAVCGPAGIGKSALALHWAHARGSRFPDGQLYLDLHGFDQRPPLAASQSLTRFLRALDPSVSEIGQDEEELAAQFRSAVSDRRLLIVLDNAADSEQVQALLPGDGQCAVLVTSRDNLAGLVTRTGAHRIELERLAAAEAVALLTDLEVAGSKEQLEALADGCDRTPLALRIAAQQLAARFGPSLSELLAELADSDRMLELLDDGDDPRTGLRAVLGWSYDRLPEPAARAYRLAGLHPGEDLSAAALAALLDTTPALARRTLTQLTRLHLARQSRPGHLSIDRLQQAHARELLTETDATEQPTAFARLAEHYLHSAALALEIISDREPPELTPAGAWTTPLPDSDAATDWWHAERSNVLAVAAEVERLDRPKGLLRLARSVVGHSARLSGVDPGRVVRPLPTRGAEDDLRPAGVN